MWNIILFVSLIIVAAMSIVSNAIEIGEKLGSVHIAVSGYLIFITCDIKTGFVPLPYPYGNSEGCT